MDKKKTFALTMLIVPWLTIPFIGKKSFIRFFPVASFINLIISVLSLIGNKKKWWITKNPLSPGPVEFIYILGPHLVATLWIFKLTYGNFFKYLFTNIVLDFVNVSLLAPIAEKVGIFKFKKMKNITWYFISVLLAILIYGYQYIVEQTIKKTPYDGS